MRFVTLLFVYQCFKQILLFFSQHQGMHELLAPIVYVLHEEAKIFPYLEGSNL